MFKNLIFFILVFIVASCTTTSHKKKDTLFKSLTSNQTGIDFTNSVIDTKSMNIFSYRNFYNGAGVAIGDINNDGLPDIYFVSNMGKNKLYLNKGNLKFEDITLKSGTAGKHAWSTGVVMVDLNNDGYLDIYVSNAGNKKGDNRKNELFINNHDLTFTEKAADYNLDEDRFTTQTAFFDYDGDGDLDAYILNNSFIPVNSLNYVNKRNLRDKDWPLPDLFKGGGDKLLRNDNGKFVDVSKEANIYGSLIGFGLGVTIGDFNNDLLPDIYVCNDFYEHDYLYINQGDGTFKDQLENQFQHLTMSSMGADIADINNDGYQDLYVNDMLQEGDQRLKLLSDFESYDVHQLKLKRDFYYQYMQNTLQLNNKNNSFSEIAFLSNTAQTDWSWAALLFDMDNDGYKDIFVTNGLYHDLTNQDFLDYFANSIIQKMALTGKKEEIEAIINKMPSTPIQNYAFKNNGNLTFSNNSNIWGFDKKTFSNGAAYGDLDNDGDLDLVINN
ncbi:MAG: FG-GAP repeat domain-containing protein, partial [Lutibacter sp.]